MSAPIHKAVMDDAIITVDGEPIAFHAQRNLPTVWFLATGARHRVIARYTGAPAPNGARYIGTALLDSGDIVLHAFAEEIA